MNPINLTPLQHAEKQLDTLRFEGMPLGDLSAHFFDRTWLNLFETSTLKNGMNLVNTLLKALGKHRYLKDSQARLLYYKSGINRHHQAMERAVRLVHSSETPLLVVGPQGNSDLATGRVFYHSGLLTLCRAVFYQLRHHRQLQAILRKTPLTLKQRCNYHIHLTQQCSLGIHQMLSAAQQQ
jgi:hypothetical protein